MKPVLSLVTLALTSLLAAPAFAVEPRGIDEAIQHRGVTFLKSQQVQNGTWNHPQIGATALAGLTLLECQVPLEDPAVQKTASAVRGACVDLKQTYSLSLVILFLDRLGDPGDESFIQSMTTRLLAGQTASCGWSYNCPLVGQHREEQRLRLAAQPADSRRRHRTHALSTVNRTATDHPSLAASGPCPFAAGRLHPPAPLRQAESRR